MTTLEKIKKVRNLEMEINMLNSEIRDEQRICEHEYDKTPSFNTTYFYGDCLKCKHRTEIIHDVNISTIELYEENKHELQKQWEILILNK